jgi:hypothetical protein
MRQKIVGCYARLMEYRPNFNHVAQNTWHIDEVFGDIQGRVEVANILYLLENVFGAKCAF